MVISLVHYFHTKVGTTPLHVVHCEAVIFFFLLRSTSKMSETVGPGYALQTLRNGGGEQGTENVQGGHISLIRMQPLCPNELRCGVNAPLE